MEAAERFDVSVSSAVRWHQGWWSETSRPTTHREPVYAIDGIIHYCVANMPSAVPLTSCTNLVGDFGAGLCHGDERVKRQIAKSQKVPRRCGGDLPGKLNLERSGAIVGAPVRPLSSARPDMIFGKDECSS